MHEKEQNPDFGPQTSSEGFDPEKKRGCCDCSLPQRISCLPVTQCRLGPRCPESLHQGGRKATHTTALPGTGGWDGALAQARPCRWDESVSGRSSMPAWGSPCASSADTQDQPVGQADGLDRQPQQGNKARGSAAGGKSPRSRFLALAVCAPMGNRAGEMGSAASADAHVLLWAEGQSSHWHPACPRLFQTNCCEPLAPAEPSGTQAALRGQSTGTFCTTATQGS